MLAAFFRRRHGGGPRVVQRRPRQDRSAALRPAGHVMTVSNSILDNPEHGQERAEKARSIAEQLADPESKRMMLRISEDYERLATYAGRRKKDHTARG
jgi:hypothetical protein